MLDVFQLQEIFGEKIDKLMKHPEVQKELALILNYTQVELIRQQTVYGQAMARLFQHFANRDSELHKTVNFPTPHKAMIINTLNMLLEAAKATEAQLKEME